MADIKGLFHMALEAGFTHAGPLDVSTIELDPKVRAMCASNNCGRYGNSWSCPPGCGELDELRQRIAQYQIGILVQTVGQLEDAFDGETMMALQLAHKDHLLELQKTLLQKYPRLLVCGSGSCTRCNTCTYPSAPCRFPDKQIVSMEAYGMLVSEICRANGMKYYYGPCTLAYTSCLLIE